ncbi:MAG: hypothetical protein KAU14_06795, partial [Thermoplasmata archaeon]|nr:hypothetical protein [Thermoplasmata archaeon]
MPYVYPVQITGAGRVVLIDQPGNYLKSRKLAEEIASFMGLGISDQSSGTEVVREARTLDEPLVHREFRTEEEAPLPVRPALPKSTIKTSGDTLHIDIEPPGFRLSSTPNIIVGFVHYLILSLFLYYFIFMFSMMIIAHLAPGDSLGFLENVSVDSFCFIGIVLSVIVSVYLAMRKDVGQAMARDHI